MWNIRGLHRKGLARKSYALRIHPRRELRKVVSLANKPPPLPPARLELGTFEDKSSQPQFNVMLRTKEKDWQKGKKRREYFLLREHTNKS